MWAILAIFHCFTINRFQIKSVIPSFKLPWPTPVDVHSLEIVNKAFNSSTKYLQSKMLFSKTSGSPCDSKKSEFQAWSAHSLRMEEIWRPLQAEIVRSVMEGAILERTTSSRLFRRQLGSRYRDIISTFLGGVKLTHFRKDLMNLATKKCKIIIDLKINIVGVIYFLDMETKCSQIYRRK